MACSDRAMISPRQLTASPGAATARADEAMISSGAATACSDEAMI